MDAQGSVAVPALGGYILGSISRDGANDPQRYLRGGREEGGRLGWSGAASWEAAGPLPVTHSSGSLPAHGGAEG